MQGVDGSSRGAAATDHEAAFSTTMAAAGLSACVGEYLGHAEPVGVGAVEVVAGVFCGFSRWVGDDGVDGADQLSVFDN